jgi:hypothetical protein
MRDVEAGLPSAGEAICESGELSGDMTPDPLIMTLLLTVRAEANSSSGSLLALVAAEMGDSAAGAELLSSRWCVGCEPVEDMDPTALSPWMSDCSRCAAVSFGGPPSLALGCGNAIGPAVRPPGAGAEPEARQATARPMRQTIQS